MMNTTRNTDRLQRRAGLACLLLALWMLAAGGVAAQALISREEGFARLNFANGKVATGEITRSTPDTFVLESPDGTAKISWDVVTQRTTIDPFDYITQRAQAQLDAGNAPEALALTRRALALGEDRALPEALALLANEQRREKQATPDEQRQAMLASAEYLMREHNYPAAVDVVTSATRQNLASADLLALGIEAEYAQHLQSLKPTSSFTSQFAPKLAALQPRHPMLGWLQTTVRNAQQQRLADANKPDLIDHIAADEKRVAALEDSYRQVEQQLAAERVAMQNAYYLNSVAGRYGAVGAWGGDLSLEIPRRNADLYRNLNYNFNGRQIVWVDDATRSYSTEPNTMFRNGGRPMTLDYAQRNHYVPFEQP